MAWRVHYHRQCKWCKQRIILGLCDDDVWRAYEYPPPDRGTGLFTTAQVVIKAPSTSISLNCRWLGVMTEFTLRSCDVQVLVGQGGDWFAVMVEHAGFTLCDILEDLHRLLDLNPGVVPPHVRVKFCPHFLLLLQYDDSKKSQRGWPKEWNDDREELIYKAIESIRRNLRNLHTGKNERKVWLSRALTYLAAPTPSRYRRQQGSRPHFSPLDRYKMRDIEGPKNVYLSENWEHKATQTYDWKKNPTRALAVQCLLRAQKHVHALDWSVFLMLSTISLTDNRQEFNDCEVRLDSINLSRREQLIGTSDKRPYLTTDEVSLYLVEFFRMVEDPYVELSARYSPNLLEAAIEKTSSKHNNAHPIIIPHLNLDTNYNHWLYLQAMQIEFEKEFSLLNEGHKKNWEWGE